MISLYTFWYLISWVAIVEANLVAFTYWWLPGAIVYLVSSGLVLSWVHGYWWDKVHSSSRTPKEVSK